MTTLKQLEYKIQTLKREVNNQRISLERKNKELDALHYVWCNGGCDGGMHRFTTSQSPLTEELVQHAERNTKRMREYFENYNYRNPLKKLGVFIGRFQPLHKGHEVIINKMISETDQQLLLIGSCNNTGTVRNPFTYEIRKDIIKQKYPNVSTEPLNDYLYNDAQWFTKVRYIIDAYSSNNNTSVVLYGHTKPDNLYLSWFKDFEYVEVDPEFSISGTEIRLQAGEQGVLPQAAQEDFDFYKKEQEQFKNYPYPETLNFMCGDALVATLDNEILLIKRKNAPGKGKWALPGGFKNNNETFYECAQRELFEETGIDITQHKVKTKKSRLFDSPKRAHGGILRSTMCQMFIIEKKIPIIANDDAAEAEWIPLNTVLNDLDMFHDHRDIISELTGVYAKSNWN